VPLSSSHYFSVYKYMCAKTFHHNGHLRVLAFTHNLTDASQMRRTTPGAGFISISALGVYTWLYPRLVCANTWCHIPLKYSVIVDLTIQEWCSDNHCVLVMMNLRDRTVSGSRSNVSVPIFVQHKKDDFTLRTWPCSRKE